MKRIAAFLLACVIATIAAASLKISGTIKNLESALVEARNNVLRADYESAEKSIDYFFKCYEQNEPLFNAFLKRDLFYNLSCSAAALPDYCTDETKYDMLAEIERTRGALEILHESTFRLI